MCDYVENKRILYIHGENNFWTACAHAAKPEVGALKTVPTVTQIKYFSKKNQHKKYRK